MPDQPFPVIETISQRTSSRTYRDIPVDDERQELLRDYLSNLPPGPFGNRFRMILVAAGEEDEKVLRGLGTYGFIQNPKGFIIGVCQNTADQLVDFGYQMEAAILKATDLKLGTCWLGGTFTRSRFLKEIQPEQGEIIPAVTSLGIPADEPARIDSITRRAAKGDRRKPPGKLFFDQEWDKPLDMDQAGDYTRVLEMVRLGPSASNKQPWRVVRTQVGYHFYLHRTPGYPLLFFDKLLRLADLQRVDMGIAMCHFELSAKELGLKGGWAAASPEIKPPEDGIEYILTWVID